VSCGGGEISIGRCLRFRVNSENRAGEYKGQRNHSLTLDLIQRKEDVVLGAR
jgi:hypothetical protein